MVNTTTSKINTYNWQDVPEGIKVSHLLAPKPAMLTPEGYTQEHTNEKKGLTVNVNFDRTFVLAKFSQLLTELNIFDETLANNLLEDSLEYHLENASEKQSSEIEELIAKYGKDAVAALLK
jgi:hypothetical protein